MTLKRVPEAVPEYGDTQRRYLRSLPLHSETRVGTYIAGEHQKQRRIPSLHSKVQGLQEVQNNLESPAAIDTPHILGYQGNFPARAYKFSKHPGIGGVGGP